MFAFTISGWQLALPTAFLSVFDLPAVMQRPPDSEGQVVSGVTLRDDPPTRQP